MGSPDRDIAQAKDFIAPPGYLRHSGPALFRAASFQRQARDSSLQGMRDDCGFVIQLRRS